MKKKLETEKKKFEDMQLSSGKTEMLEKQLTATKEKWDRVRRLFFSEEELNHLCHQLSEIIEFYKLDAEIVSMEPQRPYAFTDNIETDIVEETRVSGSGGPLGRRKGKATFKKKVLALKYRFVPFKIQLNSGFMDLAAYLKLVESFKKTLFLAELNIAKLPRDNRLKVNMTIVAPVIDSEGE